MINELDILTAVKEKLRTKYDFPVYLTPVDSTFKTPCFVLDILDSVTLHSRALLHHDMTIYLDLIANNDELTAAELFAAKSNIYELFYDGFTVKDRHIQTGAIVVETAGNDFNGIRADIPVSFFDEIPDKETNWKMLNLYHRENIKET
nr:MAG: hypothetical protein [Bacteriophage sp.]